MTTENFEVGELTDVGQNINISVVYTMSYCGGVRLGDHHAVKKQSLHTNTTILIKSGVRCQRHGRIRVSAVVDFTHVC